MRIKVGESGTLARDLPTLCCSYVVPAGTFVEVVRLHSPRRVIVGVPMQGAMSLHKVKASKVWFER